MIISRDLRITPITTDKELPGATLQILDGDEIVEEWVSTDEAHIIEGKLIVGKEYTLREITAPDGYEIAQDITFKVNEDGSVTEVIMYDEHSPEEDSPHDDTPHDDTPHSDTPHDDVPHSDTPSSNHTDVSNPHTGSAVKNTAFAGMALALMVMVISVVKRKNDNE